MRLYGCSKPPASWSTCGVSRPRRICKKNMSADKILGWSPKDPWGMTTVLLETVGEEMWGVGQCTLAVPGEDVTREPHMYPKAPPVTWKKQPDWQSGRRRLHTAHVKTHPLKELWRRNMGYRTPSYPQPLPATHLREENTLERRTWYDRRLCEVFGGLHNASTFQHLGTLRHHVVPPAAQQQNKSLCNTSCIFLYSGDVKMTCCDWTTLACN